MTAVDRRDAEYQRRQVDVSVFQVHITIGVQNCGLFWQVFHIRSGKYRTKVFVDQFQGSHRVDITTDAQGRIVRTIPAQEETFQIVNICPVEIFQPADGRPGVGVALRVHRFTVGFP